MELHPYARARAAGTQAEEVLVVAAAPEEHWPWHLVRLIVAELLRPPAAEGAPPRPAPVDSTAG